MKKRFKMLAWLKIARLQFYPMAWIAYSLGAANAAKLLGRFNLELYLAGYLFLFLLELCTVLINEYFDYGTDSVNRNASAFSGGSRVLVDGLLSKREVRWGIFVFAVLLTMSTLLLVNFIPPERRIGAFTLIILGTVLGVGYTAPPFKFCYHGLGEFVVGFTHSTYVILCGFFFQAGTVSAWTPWFLSIPLFLAVLSAIILSALPDYSADVSVSKKTFVVLAGPGNSVITVMCCVSLAPICSAILTATGMLRTSGLVLLAIAVPHAAILLRDLAKVYTQELFDCRIDRVMQLALLYILWFGIVPLIGVLW